jgi:hypothetical protein
MSANFNLNTKTSDTDILSVAPIIYVESKDVEIMMFAAYHDVVGPDKAFN